MEFPEEYPQTLGLEELNLIPSKQWPQKFNSYWEVSEKAAQKHLQVFLDHRAEDYDFARDIPKKEGTSSLSPYLRWGLIGPRQIIHALKSKYDMTSVGPQTYSKEIYWREFAYNVLYHYPNTPDAPLQEKYSDFPWESDAELLSSWQRGKTGYPIVDAGMRQMYQTGWMHNRVRMIVSSLLVKHLLQDWREGARWFWDTLVDADLASNTLGWQWSGGCGADAAPYFRIFNPITQGKKFDPDGEYVKQWVPELSNVPKKYIHEPWEASKDELESYGLDLGTDYPKPIIEHSLGRKRALEALATLKNS
jgi:deoxyribodipyrimidine photo-lyase